MTAHPSFSVIIPTYQRRDVVCDAVRALCEITYEGAVEIIVVVDGSTDGTAAALRELDCPISLRIIEQDNRGAAGARNRGAAQADGEILLFIDDDMMCEPDLVEQHARMYREGADAVTGEVFLDPGSPQTFLTDAVALWISLPRPETAQLPFHVYTGQLSVRRTVFNAVGGFDEEFTSTRSFGHEDTDIGVKLIAGYDVRHNPEAISRQRYVVGPRESMERAARSAVADIRFLTMYPQFSEYILAQRGGSQWKTRYVYRPLTHVPFVPRTLSRIAVWVSEALIDTRFGSSRLLRYFFFAARAVSYWSTVRMAGGFPSSHSLLVLCYHAMRDQSGDPVLAPYGVPPDRFAAQLKSLTRRGFVFIGPDQLAAFLSRGAPLPRRSVLLTFDDCYDDLLEVARQVLAPMNIPAIAFAVTGTRTGTNEWDQTDGAETLPLLTPDELGQLTALGVEIGAHSRTHPILPHLSPEEQELEAAGACEDLVAAGIPRPRFFAYPYGASDSGTVKSVRDAGYVAAFGVNARRVDRTSDPFCLPRVPILSPDKGWRFRCKTAYPRFFDWFELNLRRASKVLKHAASSRLA